MNSPLPPAKTGSGGPRRRWKLWALRLALLFALLLVAALLLLPSGEEPVFQGRTALVWARDLAHPDPAVRSNAVAALQRIGPDAIPPLTRAIGERDSLLRKPFVSAVPRLSRKTRVWFLQTFRPFDAALDREAALRGLMVLGTNVPVALLARALHDPERQIAALAAEALSRLDGAAVPALAKALHDPEPYVRSMACYGLYLVGPGASAAVPDLIERLADPEGNIVAQAVAVLGRVGPEAVPALVKALKSPEAGVRGQSVRLLGGCGSRARPALPAVRELLQDPDPGVRSNVVEALKAIDR